MMLVTSRVDQSVTLISHKPHRKFHKLYCMEPKGRVSRKQIVIFKKVTTCFNFEDMFQCCQHHRQLQNI